MVAEFNKILKDMKKNETSFSIIQENQSGMNFGPGHSSDIQNFKGKSATFQEDFINAQSLRSVQPDLKNKFL